MLLGLRRHHAAEDHDVEGRDVVVGQHLVELVGRVRAETPSPQDVGGVEDHARTAADDQNPGGACVVHGQAS
ncbi:hypothetical protein [Dactylosporangium cerinum]